MSGWIFALAGATAGAVQARSLGRSARGGGGPLAAAGRLVLVAAVLLLAALAGHVVAGLAGWVAGFGAAGALVYRRLP